MGFAMSLPSGFVLDSQQSIPGLPPGFTLDQQAGNLPSQGKQPIPNTGNNFGNNQAQSIPDKMMQWGNTPATADLSDLPTFGQATNGNDKLGFVGNTLLDVMKINSGLKAVRRGLGTTFENQFIKPPVAGMGELLARAGGEIPMASDTNTGGPLANISPNAVMTLAMLSPKSAAMQSRMATEPDVPENPPIGNRILENMNASKAIDNLRPLAETPDPIRATSADIRSAASTAYRVADEKDGLFSPQFTNKFLDSMGGEVTEPERVTDALGATPVQNIVSGIEKKFRDTPMTLSEAHSIDKRLGDAWIKELDAKTGRPTEVGKQILGIQNNLRDMISNPESGDLLGSSEGINALNQGRQLWAQSAKLGDIERIIERAQMMENPSTALKTGFRTLYNNKGRMLGYTDIEKAAIKRAAERGIIEDLFNTFGSKLGPVIAGSAGMIVGGPLGAAASGLTNYGLSSTFRNFAEKMQMNRANAALDAVANRELNFSPIQVPQPMALSPPSPINVPPGGFEAIPNMLRTRQ